MKPRATNVRFKDHGCLLPAKTHSERSVQHKPGVLYTPELVTDPSRTSQFAARAVF